MKKYCVIQLILTLFSYSSFGQTTWGENNSRTETRQDAGLQGNAGAMSGFYQTDQPVNFPAGAQSWWHLLDVRHSNPVNNYAMQFAGGFFDQELFFRKTNNNAGQDWSRVLMENNHRVGIGTTSPRAFLDVAYDISNGQLGTVLGRLPEGNGDGDGTFLGVRGYATQGVADHVKSFAIEHSFYGIVNSSINFFRGGGKEGGYLTFNTYTNNEQMRITPQGEVGIGTTDTKGYKLAVNGGMIATAVTVKTYNNWPDYVFKKTYQLKPLTELQFFIDQNHHLPEIPKEAEVLKQGQDLGEMNKLLLKKVEELTLYLIEQNRRIEKMEHLLSKKK